MTQTTDPQYFVALELMPNFEKVKMDDLDGLNTAQLFDLAASAPKAFDRRYRVFKTIEACKEYAATPGTAVLEIVPLCIEPNELLGY